MKKNSFRNICCGWLLLPIQLSLVASGDIATTLWVEDEIVAEIDPRLFGSFAEKAPPSEPGPDAATDSMGEMDPAAVDALEKLHLPLIRYPGGYVVENRNYDWTSLIDNAPGREREQRVLYKGKARDFPWGFGLDQFLTLCETLGSEPLLTVKLSDAYERRTPILEAANHAAAMVAYCNGTLETVPERFLPYVKARIENGRVEPWGVDLWQIGNESFIFMRRDSPLKDAAVEEKTRQLVDSTVAFAEAMLEVDASIDIIADVQAAKKLPKLIPELKMKLGPKIAFMSRHKYVPWGISADSVRLGDSAYSRSELTYEEIWNAYVAPLPMDDAGLVEPFSQEADEMATEAGYPIAITEWNWNGGWWDWNTETNGPRPPDPLLAKGIGAASFLHSFLRSGHRIKLGCQSMLIGDSWQIGSVAVVEEEGEIRYLPRPTGLVTALYSQYHGDELLSSEQRGSPSYEQPFSMKWLKANETVAYLDSLITRRGEVLYVHVINRHPTETLALGLKFPEGFLTEDPKVTCHTVTGDPKAETIEQMELMSIDSISLGFLGSDLEEILQIPPHSVSVFVLK